MAPVAVAATFSNMGRLLLLSLVLVVDRHPAMSFQPQSSALVVARERRMAEESCPSLSSYLLMSTSSDDDDAVLLLPLMEAELDTMAINKDEKRAELEEKIDNAKTAAEFGVRRAQVEFYTAFSNQDIEAMKRVWSDGEDVRCVHPGMRSIGGLEDIMASWQQIFSSGAKFSIEPERVSIDICGRTALCSCVEGTPGGGKLEALNVYRRERGSWRMTLHMASPIIVQVSG